MSKFQKPSDRIGEVIGNLKLSACLGIGGMGAVYRAEHLSLGTPYAVKVLHPQFSNDRTIAERFRREALSCSRLRHPNVVFVTDFGIHPEMGIYIIMEYLEGLAINQILKREPQLTTGRTVHLGKQICGALAAAHALDIVHRDMKPDNIVVIRDAQEREQCKVLDFGIARIKAGDDEGGDQLTRAGLVLGTPSYISPEQLNRKGGDVMGPWIDVYAVGVIFHRMLAGDLPFKGNTEFEVISQHLFKAPDPIGNFRPDLSGSRLEALILQMLAKKPEERPRSMDEVVDLLQQSISELQERGVQDAFDSVPAVNPSRSSYAGNLAALPTPTSIGITKIIKQLGDDTTSTIAQLLTAMRSAADLPEDVFYMAYFGVLQREWLDTLVDTPQHAHLTRHLAFLMSVVLDSHNGPEPSTTQGKVLRAFRDMLAVDDKDHARPLVVALQPMRSNPLFPDAILPDWAQASGSGRWSVIKSLMSTELRLGGGKKSAEPDNGSSTSSWNRLKAIAAPTGEGGEAAAPAAAAHDPNETSEARREREKSLGYKLRQDASVGTLKSVLTHEFSLFGRKKKKKGK